MHLSNEIFHDINIVGNEAWGSKGLYQYYKGAFS